MPTATTAAIVASAGEPFTVTAIELDDPRPTEVRVRMVAAGLCHTDLSVQAGYIPLALPAVLGHEGAGIVEAVGSAVTRVRPGDAVVLTFTSCAQCRPCRDGHPAYCATWVSANMFNGGHRPDGSATIRRDGTPVAGRFFGQSSFSCHALVEERSVVAIDADLPLELMAPLGCGIQTGAGTVLNVLRPRAGSTLAVFGTGAVGLAAVAAAALSPLGKIIAVDRVPQRLQLAKEFGATHTVDGALKDVTAALHDLTGSAGIDYAIDTTANMTVLRAAVESLATFGVAAAVGAAPLGTELTLDYTGMLPGRSVIGVTEGDSNPYTFIPVLVNLYRQGKLPLDKLITTYSFDDINVAAADAREGRTIKPVLVFGDSR